jgi:hypothetical protein
MRSDVRGCQLLLHCQHFHHPWWSQGLGARGLGQKLTRDSGKKGEKSVEIRSRLDNQPTPHLIYPHQPTRYLPAMFPNTGDIQMTGCADGLLAL